MATSMVQPPVRLDPGVAPAPEAPRHPAASDVHGVRRIDDYAWLRNFATDPAVETYLRAEQAYTDAVMAPAKALQQVLYDETLSHIKQTDLSVPYRQGLYEYYVRTEEGKQYPVYCRKRNEAAPEEIVLDLNVLAEGEPFLALGRYEVSDDGSWLAYSLDRTGYRQYTLFVKDLRAGVLSSEAIPRVNDVEWAKDNATLFYVTEDEVSKRSDRVWRHRVGAPESEQCWEELDERYDLALDRSLDGDYIFAVSHSKATTETAYLRADRPQDGFTVLYPRRDDHRYYVDHHAGEFLIVTNAGAPDFRIVSVDAAAPTEATWRELVAERPCVHIDGLTVFERYAVVSLRTGGFAGFEVLEFATGRRYTVDFPEAAHSAFALRNREYRSDAFRFGYQSLVTPHCVYDLALATGERTLRKRTEVPGYDQDGYVAVLIEATARDGTAVPISLVHRKDAVLDGSAPLLLYGYGSYGLSMDPDFSASRLPLLDRGVIYATAHIRGGGELGEGWRVAGHLQRKLNTFTDFIDSAKHLIAAGYTSAQRLAIEGGSAGGLLVGAVVNMEHGLFKAAVAEVPFVDVMNTMLDASLPLTTGEYLEWGDPGVATDFEYMLRYSPYDNVRAQPYPALLVRVSIYDSQVPYWEGAKFVAKLRAHSDGDAPLLLDVNFGAGHGGASGRYDRLKEAAFVHAFILSQIA